jgi:2-aminoadipate transaminase
MSFGEAPPPSLFALDEQQVVIQLSSLSKSLAGGLRLGWMAAAEPIVEQLALVKQRADVCTPTLEQLVVAEFLATHHYDGHLKTLRHEHLRRRDAMVSAIARQLPPGLLTFAVPTGGMFLWCRLPQAIDARDLAREALAAGVAVVHGDLFYPDLDTAGRHEVRLCFTSVTPERIEEGVGRLAAVLTSHRVRTHRDAGLRALV